MPRQSITFTDEQDAWIKKLATAFSMSEADVVRRLIQREMDGHKNKRTGKLPPIGYVGNPFGWPDD